MRCFTFSVFYRFLSGLSLVLLVSSVALAGPLDYDPPAVDDLVNLAGHEMRDVLARYTTDREGLNRYDGTDASRPRVARMRAFYTDWRAAIESIDFDSLSHDAQVDYLLFRNRLDYELRRIDTEEKHLDEMAALIPFAPAIVALNDARRLIEPVDAAAAAETLKTILEQIEETREAVKAGMAEDQDASDEDGEATNAITGISRPTANRAVRIVNDLKRTLDGWYGFYAGYDPEFTWWMEKPAREVREALRDYAKFLREEAVGIKDGDDETIFGEPIGADGLQNELEYEMIPYTAAELITIAKMEFAWCEQEMKRAANDLGFGDDWHAALEHVKTLHVAPGEQPALIRELAYEAMDFLDEHELVTVDEMCRDLWRMNMMSPERQRYTPFFTGGEIISVAFPTEDMTQEEKVMALKSNNIHFSRATVHHELIPGHHLQGYMAARYRNYRRMFATPFWGEGWALYWEMLLWDLDFQESAENRVGMLFWRMHRCARIIFSLSYHLEEMTPEECIDFLVERVGHERSTATAEVRRSIMGGYGPLYQAAYMLGGLQFRALHRELVESGKMTNRDFHDAILRLNRIPVEMVRASLTDQPLTRDFNSNWRFYGDPDPVR